MSNRRSGKRSAMSGYKLKGRYRKPRARFRSLLAACAIGDAERGLE